jgi:hypothetical protein
MLRDDDHSGSQTQQIPREVVHQLALQPPVSDATVHGPKTFPRTRASAPQMELQVSGVV